MKLYELADLAQDNQTEFYVYTTNEWDNLRIISWKTDTRSTEWRNQILQKYGQQEVGSIRVVNSNGLGVYLK